MIYDPDFEVGTLLERVLSEVGSERKKQDHKWGEQNHEALYWLPILTEEVGEVAKELAEARIDSFDRKAYRAELIQVAAVAVAAIESLDRNGC